MELINKVICDTGIISDYLTQQPPVFNQVNEIGVQNLIITPVILSELNRWLSLYKGLTKAQRMLFSKFIKNLPLLHLNENISKIAVEISDKNNSLDIADILIGATALYHKTPLFTLNSKHFKQINGLLFF